jgi:hypothetical protein
MGRGGKVGKLYTFRLTLDNRQVKPVWFVFPFEADDRLAADGIFPNRDWNDIPFGGKLYKGKGGTATGITMYGGKAFHAFLVPAQGHLEFKEFGQYARTEVSGLEVLEVDSLKVNGKVPIEKWLPYKVVCDHRVTISPKAYYTDWENLDNDPGRPGIRGDYPKEKVVNVEAEGIRRWELSFGKVKRID